MTATKNKSQKERFHFYCDKTAYTGGKCPMKGEKRNICLQSNHHRCPNLMIFHEDPPATTNRELIVKKPKKKAEFHYNAKAFCSEKCHMKAETNYKNGLKYNGLRWVWDTIVIGKGLCLECRKKPHRMKKSGGTKE